MPSGQGGCGPVDAGRKEWPAGAVALSGLESSTKARAQGAGRRLPSGYGCPPVRSGLPSRLAARVRVSGRDRPETPAATRRVE
ncbi:hypothetical protein FAIPA1_50068 [Frankia sp. AiPs1]